MSFTPSQTPDKNYYDVTITNIDNTNSLPPVLYFNEARSNPYVLDPESYYLSIVRFTLDTPTLPIFIPVIQPNQGDLNLTIYSVTLSWTNPLNTSQIFNQQTFIQYSPQELSNVIPSPPSANEFGLQNSSTGYYNIYNYQYWISLINTAFTNCFNSLNTQVVTAGLVLPTTHAPVLSWDITNNIAILNADDAGYNNANSSVIQIWMNSALYQLFSSFPVILYGYVNPVLGKNILIQTDAFGGANIVAFPPSAAPANQYQALQIVQEYSTIALWTPITSIVFTTTTLPVVPANISAPLLFLNGQAFNNGGNNSNIAQIITDFVSDTGIYKPNIVYTPTAQYRLINLTGNKPISNLDIQVFFKDRIGILQPFRLSSGSTATIKFLFTRKGTQGKPGF